MYNQKTYSGVSYPVGTQFGRMGEAVLGHNPLTTPNPFTFHSS